MRKNRLLSGIVYLILAIVLLIASELISTGIDNFNQKIEDAQLQEIEISEEKIREDIRENTSYGSFSLDEIPEYSGEPFVVVNSNKPFFTEEEITAAKNNKGYEYYEPLDYLGRATMGESCIDITIRPAKGEARGDISSVRPTGWKQNQYDFIDSGGWLYNRSHLLGYQLTGENDNERNLITGTRQFNAGSMLPFENMVADYLKEEESRKLLYRVTAIYKDDELVARGVLMEALSVTENDYDDLEYCVFVYNVQDGVYIDYKTGDNYEIK